MEELEVKRVKAVKTALILGLVALGFFIASFFILPN